ncbi:MAG: hypothetical protein ACNS64_03320 [Candidatus Halalkalibacterium sp. M3_1C_030]
MFLLESDELLEHTSNIIHEDTQKQNLNLDLTVSKIFSFTEAGSLDFGGGEFEEASGKFIEPVKQSTDADYGWWILKEGTYKAVFNESLHNLEDTLVALSLHDHASLAGIIANSRLVTPDHSLDEITMNFQVPKNGCNIKENARFATLHLIAD